MNPLSCELLFTELYNRHFPMVRRIAADRMRPADVDLAEDFAQEAFLNLWSMMANGVSVLYPAALLRLIVKRRVADHYRRARTRRERAADFSGEVGELRLPASRAAEDDALDSALRKVQQLLAAVA
jgi:DNA-directed RNA polymerase specialized sigma24 family protein